MSIGRVSSCNEVALVIAWMGECGIELSCFEMALKAGLIIRGSFHEPDRAAGGFM